MTIKLTSQEFYEQFQEAEEKQLQWDATDRLDIVKKFDTRIAQGWWRDIWLRDGTLLNINKAQHCDRVAVNFPEAEHRIAFIFTLSGQLQKSVVNARNERFFPQLTNKYFIRGNGFCPPIICDCLNAETYSELQIGINPEVIQSFVVPSNREFTQKLQHLIKNGTQESYLQSRTTQPAMTTVLQQILHCPYQGTIERMYLESKVIELVALVLDYEAAIDRGKTEKSSLKPEQLERIHYAKEILLRDISNPPSLKELARQAGLNDFILKQGFHYCFNNTVFGLLRDRRLELAKQLLADRDISVSEAGYQVGYASLAFFSQAFKRKFGISPKAHQKVCR